MARNGLLREPLDAAGNRSFGSCVQRAQLRELRRTRPCVRGFPSVGSTRGARKVRFRSQFLTTLHISNFRTALAVALRPSQRSAHTIDHLAGESVAVAGIGGVPFSKNCHDWSGAGRRICRARREEPCRSSRYALVLCYKTPGIIVAMTTMV